MTCATAGDGQILALFQEWKAAQTIADAFSRQSLGSHYSGEGPQPFDQAYDRIDRLVQAIAALPSQGPAGLAIKAYLRHHILHGGPADGAPYTLSTLEDPKERAETALERAIIADAARFVPELAPLAAAVIGSAAADKAA